MDGSGMVTLLTFVCVLAFVVRALLRKARRGRLMTKYGDAQVADGIMRKKFWIGMTHEMLTDSLGRPADIDERLLKTKASHTYKYHPSGRNRYKTRIKLDNGRVVGWDLK